MVDRYQEDEETPLAAQGLGLGPARAVDHAMDLRPEAGGLRWPGRSKGSIGEPSSLGTIYGGLRVSAC